MGVIFQQGISVSKDSKSTINSFNQEILFHYSYENYAWGHQYKGWYIDSDANVWNFKEVQHWSAEEGAIITNKNNIFWYDSDSLNQSYHESRDTIITNINSDSLNHYYQLINIASTGEYSKPENVGNDIGSFIFGCLYYEDQAKKYRKVILSLFGDWMFKNLDSNAIKIDDWLKRIHQTVIVGMEKNEASIFTKYCLSNYPNPFNPSTTIEFQLPKSSNVTLKIFNILGKEVAILVSDRLTAGSYTYDWDASNMASGVYLYHLKAGDFVETKKMILMR